MFIIFSRRLYKEWFLFLDDLTVATGRPSSLPPGVPSGAHDVFAALGELQDQVRAETRGERAADGRDVASGSARGGGSGNGTNPGKRKRSRPGRSPGHGSGAPPCFGRDRRYRRSHLG